VPLRASLTVRKIAIVPVASTGSGVGAADVGVAEGVFVGEADGFCGADGVMVSTGFGVNCVLPPHVHADVLTASAVPRTTAAALPQRAARSAATLFA
jgi:hypothetical protein